MVVDIVGIALLALLAALAVVSGMISGGSAIPVVAVMAASAASLTVGRATARIDRRLVATIVFAFVAGVFIVSAVSSGTRDGPLGYENASALLAVLGSVAGMMLASPPGSTPLRLVGLAGAVTLGCIPFLVGAVASSIIVILALAALAFVRISGRVRWGILGTAGVSLVVLSTTVVLGLTYQPDDQDAVSGGVAESSLSERRLALWHDALIIAAEHPIIGVGPGRFPFVSPVAASDADTRQAHNEFLQQAAEIGVPGALVFVLLVPWGYSRLLLVPRSDLITLLGSVALAALAIGASVDYVLHFALVPVARRRRSSERPRPTPPRGARLSSRPRAPRRALMRSPHSSDVDGGSVFQVTALARKGVKAAALPVGLLRPRRRGDVVVLLYHRVGEGDREIDLPKASFEQQLLTLVRHDRVRSLDDALSDREGGVVLTFDDGYRDFYSHVLPLLVRYRLPGLLYLATGLVANGSGGSPAEPPSPGRC